MKKILLLCGILILVIGCKYKQPTISSTELITVVETQNSKTNDMAIWIEAYKSTLDRVMSVPIGYSQMTMEAGLPESLLGNLITTIIDDYCQKNGKPCDCIITNIGGIRDSLSKGEITIGSIYRIAPFDNKLVILTLSGKEIENLCQIIAKSGGQVTSKISMQIENNSAKNIKINNQPLDTNKNYRVTTIDYLSFGNDGLLPLAKYTDIYSFDIPIRDLIINYIREKTKKRELITSKLNNEVVIIKK